MQYCLISLADKLFSLKPPKVEAKFHFEEFCNTILTVSVIVVQTNRRCESCKRSNLLSLSSDKFAALARLGQTVHCNYLKMSVNNSNRRNHIILSSKTDDNRACISFWMDCLHALLSSAQATSYFSAVGPATSSKIESVVYSLSYVVWSFAFKRLYLSQASLKQEIQHRLSSLEFILR